MGRARSFNDAKVDFLEQDQTVIDINSSDSENSASSSVVDESAPIRTSKQTNQKNSIKTFETQQLKDFNFLVGSHDHIQAEAETFEKLLEILKKDKSSEVQNLRYGCYDLLHSYYKLSRNAKKEEYKQKRDSLIKKPRSFKKRVTGSIKGIYDSTTDFDALYDWTGYLNVLRIYWLFSRLSLNALVNHSNSTNQWMDKANVASSSLTVSQAMQIINAANETMLYLSVILFALKLAWTIFATIEYLAKTRGKDKYLRSRLRDQLIEQHIKVINDFMWLVVNFLTNFTKYSKIPVPIANWLTAGFLVADVAVLVWLQIFKYKVYCSRKNELSYQIKKLGENSENSFIIKQQLGILKSKYQATFLTVGFNITGALVIATGFAVGISACSGGFLLGMLGTSIYMSAKSFENLLTKQFEADRLAKLEKNYPRSQELRNWLDEKKLKDLLDQAKIERNWALCEFIAVGVFKNIVIPQLIIILFPICWPASVALAAAFIAVLLSYKGYQALKPDLDNKPGIPSSEKLDKDLGQGDSDRESEGASPGLPSKN